MNAAELDLIAAVRRRAATAATRTDQSDVSPTSVARALSDAEITKVEARLGLRVPSFLRSVYSNIGNGGFGPGYGLMGLLGGFTDDQARSVVDLYEHFRQSDPKDPVWQWPAHVLPVCHWGCGIYSCVDCSTDDGRILIWDSNVWEQGTPVETALRAGHSPVVEWFRSWAAGEDIWQQMFPDVGDESA